MMSSRFAGRDSRQPNNSNRIGDKATSKQEGIRPLNRMESKAREQKDGSRGPEVQRVHRKEDRVALATLQAGQQMRGKIISVTEFGLFVDIGTTRDGLVHVKDISKDYFVRISIYFLPIYAQFWPIHANSLGTEPCSKICSRTRCRCLGKKKLLLDMS